ncbi:hypothetical protein E3P86_00352 [Wallemia ichthyophaga]|uniref:Cofilin n=1 Tax=Wallemia ichthyophaga TaxID=245174 RepID=A0A4T0JIM6_WALIC|nr:hypothetical protein E3P86_00352 [Wallemia ichthyophaga]
MKWLNTKLEACSIEPMTDLARDLSNGVRLIQLMEIMGDVNLGRYNVNPRMRVQKAENVTKALDFIRSRGIVLTNIGPEDIMDQNLKLILGMIWTLILRFTIAEISEEGLQAKEGLLLWCQRKTAPYQDVNVENFTSSWVDGFALCALIHCHRPDLLDYHALDPVDRFSNTKLAFDIAEQHLGIPQLLDVEDLCTRPDERSTMTYVASYFHAFSSMDRQETNARRVAAFADVMASVWQASNRYEVKVRALLWSLEQLKIEWGSSPPADSYADVKLQSGQLAEHKKTTKRTYVSEKADCTALFGNIQTKLKTYKLRPYDPPVGDLDEKWAMMAEAEANRSRAINARIRDIKDLLRRSFAQVANSFERSLSRITVAIGELDGKLESQLTIVKELQAKMEPLAQQLHGGLYLLERDCLEANIEENDYTIFSFDDLEFEFELVQLNLKNKFAFLENQIVSREASNVTPDKLEEFESTFRYFDRDDSNCLSYGEFGAALASLGITYPEDEMVEIHDMLAKESELDGYVSFREFVRYMVEIMEDSTDKDQVREAFEGVSGNKPYVTEVDIKLSALGGQTMESLKTQLPVIEEDGEEGYVYDYNKFLDEQFIVVKQELQPSSTSTSLHCTTPKPKRKYTKRSSWWSQRKTQSTPTKSLLPPLELDDDMSRPSTSTAASMAAVATPQNLYSHSPSRSHTHTNSHTSNLEPQFVKGKGRMLVRNMERPPLYHNHSFSPVGAPATSLAPPATPQFLVNYMSDDEEGPNDKLKVNHDAKSALIRKRRQLRKARSEMTLSKTKKHKLSPKTPELAPTATYHDRFIHGLPYARNANNLFFGLQPSPPVSFNESHLPSPTMATPANLMQSTRKSKLSSGLGITPRLALDDMTDDQWRHQNMFSSPTFGVEHQSPVKLTPQFQTSHAFINAMSTSSSIPPPLNYSSSSAEHSIIMTPSNFNDSPSKRKLFNDSNDVFDIENAIEEIFTLYSINQNGVPVADECLTTFQDLKLGKKHKYMILKISDDSTAIVCEKTSNSDNYDEFLNDLPENEPRWAVYDFQFTKGDEGTRNKILFYAWAPDTAKVKPKMMYASSKDALRSKLNGIHFDIQCTDSTECAFDTVMDKVSKGA